MKTTIYTFAVYVTVGHDDEGVPDYTAKDMERVLASVLKRMSGDTDYELMETETSDDAEPVQS